MSDIRLLVKTEKLIEISGEIEKFSSRLKKTFDDIESTVDKSSGYWDGSGNDAYIKAFKKQKKKMEDILSGFSNHTNNLVLIAQGYEQSERANVNITTQLPGDVIE